jgi:hypothetical protein
VRTDEGADKPCTSLTPDVRVGERFSELRSMFSQTLRDAQESSVLGQEILEVQRPSLRFLKLVCQHSVNRSPDDRGLDHGGRVHAHYCLAVKK